MQLINAMLLVQLVLSQMINYIDVMHVNILAKHVLPGLIALHAIQI